MVIDPLPILHNRGVLTRYYFFKLSHFERLSFLGGCKCLFSSIFYDFIEECLS